MVEGGEGVAAVCSGDLGFFTNSCTSSDKLSTWFVSFGQRLVSLIIKLWNTFFPVRFSAVIRVERGLFGKSSNAACLHSPIASSKSSTVVALQTLRYLLLQKRKGMKAEKRIRSRDWASHEDLLINMHMLTGCGTVETVAQAKKHRSNFTDWLVLGLFFIAPPLFLSPLPSAPVKSPTSPAESLEAPRTSRIRCCSLLATTRWCGGQSTPRCANRSS